MSEWEPGTVAVATVRGVEGVRVMRSSDRTLPWRSATRVLNSHLHADRHVTDVRPLVVLDKADLPLATGWADVTRNLRTADGSIARTWVAEQIEAQTKPPKREVYEHLATDRGTESRESLCGKLWKPSPDDVTVVGRCPMCASMAETGWIA